MGACYMNVILSVASIFDPRQKLKSIELYFSLIYGEHDDEIKITEVKQVLETLFEEYSKSCNTQSNVVSHAGASCPPTPRCSGQSDAHARGLWVSRMRRLGKYIEDSSSRQPTKTELQLYLDEFVLPFEKDDLSTESDDFDVLGWWKENTTKYHILSLIARDILGVPIFIVASEATFSTGGRVVSHTKNSLHPSTVEGLICTQDWLRNELKGQGIDKVEDALATIFSPEVEEDNITIAEDDDLDNDDDDDDISLSHI